MTTNLDYLLPQLRMELGDLNPLSYRYTDEWLRVALETSIKALQRWWNNRYLIDPVTDEVIRNPDFTYTLADPPILETSDEIPITLMAAFLIRDGSLESNSWNVGTWRDAEYYVSNVEGGRLRDASLQRTWDRLLMYLTPPTKRLHSGAREAFNFGADETT